MCSAIIIKVIYIITVLNASLSCKNPYRVEHGTIVMVNLNLAVIFVNFLVTC